VLSQVLQQTADLLSWRRSARRGGARRLRHAQVARRRCLRYFVDHEFQRRVASAGVEEDRFVNRAVLFLEALVVGKHVDGVLVLLGVRVFQLDHNRAHAFRAGFARDRELKIIALAHAAQLVDFIVVTGDQGAHLATSHLDTVFRGIQVSLHAVDVTVQLVDVIGVRLRSKLGVDRTLEAGQFFCPRQRSLPWFACGRQPTGFP